MGNAIRLVMSALGLCLSMQSVLADPDPNQACNWITGNYSVKCIGPIDKIEELNRIRFTNHRCIAFSFVLEGKETVTGRSYYPSSKSFSGAVENEATIFNEPTLGKVTTVRSGSWNDDYSSVEVINQTTKIEKDGCTSATVDLRMTFKKVSSSELALMIRKSEKVGSASEAKEGTATCILTRQSE